MNEPVTWGPRRADAARNWRLLPVTARDITDGQGTVQLTMDGLAERAGLGKETVFHRLGTRAFNCTDPAGLLDLQDLADFAARVASARRGCPGRRVGFLPVVRAGCRVGLARLGEGDAVRRDEKSGSGRGGRGWRCGDLLVKRQDNLNIGDANGHLPLPLR
jgi:hypothetical protein